MMEIVGEWSPTFVVTSKGCQKHSKPPRTFLFFSKFDLFQQSTSYSKASLETGY